MLVRYTIRYYRFNWNGQEYLYENTPYYDKKKKIRQRSKYLGKNFEVVPIRVRSQEKVPKKVLSHGEFVPLKKIIEDLELEKTLFRFPPVFHSSIRQRIGRIYFIKNMIAGNNYWV